MPSADDRGPGQDERPLGERPGLNHNPLGASFRDGPRTLPASARSLLLGLLPVVLGLALLFLLLR